ncbi:MAG: nitroreductase family protein [Clostridia bacterium]|nr:nitroreductase family protein [Clostridia bacterium]
MSNPILKRRSVRKFKDTPVSREMIDRLLEAAMAAPSACNKRPVDFYVISGEEKLHEISMCGRFTRMKAPLIIVVVGNLKRALPLEFSEYWIQDASAATQNILIEATALGLGSCWCGIHPQKRMVEKVRAALGLTDKEIPLSMIKLGYPDEFPQPHSGYDEKRVHFVE